MLSLLRLARVLQYIMKIAFIPNSRPRRSWAASQQAFRCNVLIRMEIKTSWMTRSIKSDIECSLMSLMIAIVLLLITSQSCAYHSQWITCKPICCSVAMLLLPMIYPRILKPTALSNVILVLGMQQAEALSPLNRIVSMDFTSVLYALPLPSNVLTAALYVFQTYKLPD